MTFHGPAISSAPISGSPFYGPRITYERDWSPDQLFNLGEVGVWYDPSDLTTLFTDTAGTTQVTAAGQEVALMLDKSRGLALGPELVTVGWTTDAGWTQDGQTFVAASAAANAEIEKAGLVTANRTYQVTITWAGLSSSSAWRFYLFQFVSAFDISQITDGVSGARTYRVTAPSSGTITALRCLTAGGSGTFTLSIRELPGNHATQGTLAARPIYAVVPKTGRRNLLTYSEQFDNAAWAKLNATISPDNSTAPSGTTTAELVTSGGGETRVGSALGFVSGNTTYTITIYGKYVNENGRYLWFRDFFAQRDAGFDLQQGSVSQVSAGMSASISAADNGFFRCVVTWTTPASAAVANQQYFVQSASGTNVSSGTLGGQCIIWGAQLETGSTATDYQRVVSQYDVSEAGVEALHYLSFDGTDDSLATSTITPGADKAQVFAGVRKLSDATTAIIFELTANSNLNNGGLGLFSPFGAAANYGIRSRGTSAGSITVEGTSPETAILTAVCDISGDVASLGKNGGAKASSATDQGTGNYATSVAYIGRKAGISEPFNGRLYGLIVRFSAANLGATQISNAERWLARKTGVVLP